MYSLLGRAVIKARWFIVVGILGVFAIGATWGLGVFDEFTDGGYVSQDAQSVRDAAAIEEEFGSTGAEVVVLYESETMTADDPAFAAAVQSAVADIAAIEEVENVLSYYDTRLPTFVSEDGHATYAAVSLTGSSDEAQAEVFDTIESQLREAGDTGDLEVTLGGGAAVFADLNEQVQHDLEIAEMISMPILLLIMIVVFGALVAASLPLLIGGMSILGGFAITRVITEFTDVSIFAANVITIIGLGMSIDYSLFVLRRFREELAAGRDKRRAVLHTVATAGRTVMVSGLIIVLSMVGLLLVDVPFLHGIAYGVMSAVGVAMLSALVALPAILYLLGHRVDKGRLPWRRNKAPKTDTGFWHTLAAGVMRRPVLVLLPVLAFMALLASPILDVQFGGVDERDMPADAESRVVTETLAEDFPGGGEETFQVMVTGEPEAWDRVAAELAALDAVDDVRPAAEPTADAILYDVAYDFDPFSAEARELIEDARAIEADGADLFITGGAADRVDMLDAIAEGLPYMLGYIVIVTMIVLFLAFGSIVLPIKAVLMNAVSLGAALGAVVWIFGEGHLSGLLDFTPSGYIDPSNLLLMIALLFALATDYEVFLLSRVREEWDLGADNRTAVLRGMQSTGSIITAAAAILIVVVGAFAFSGITFMKMIGLGMAIAIFLDATVVRMLLVPATMRLLGRANWWVPGPLAKLYSKYGIKETDDSVAAVEDRSPARV
ncbi:MMPL family transporter [Glycomyces sp. TRM65418]|uniref:MMPL family transporter n=1 Tax=Glycomyces sp. TRM65418 TaxID=2867006 RepID=UPI001CE6BB67|nr:MMPL family transporter [Glycomyces sp. TRM65418]MCC3762198.1 MMPL family transporter [Glycomyces sp. TRM65418]QZD56256.1 MMPL family transporter [Glycomyces sp. TRM65418]